MTARVSYSRELLIALLVAIWIHVAIFVIFVILLVFELLAGKVLGGVERTDSDLRQSEVTELTVFFEEPEISELEEAQAIKARPEKRQKFAQTEATEVAEKAEEAEFEGENNSVATSDVQAREGSEDQVALGGKNEVQGDIKTTTSDFSEGEEKGAKMDFPGEGSLGLGRDAVTQEEVPPTQPEVMANKVDTPKDYEATDGEERKIEDAMPENVVEKSEPDPVDDRGLTPDKNKENAKPQVAKTQGGGSGGYRSKQTKTRIRGTLNALGKGSLNVENTALGRYEATVFKEIEREWQARNFQFRSHLAPGFITLSFHLDEQGNVSGQRRTDMRGTSGIQWGLVLQSVQAAKIPAMPKDLRGELNGEALELTVTFNY
ncbi:MAG: hypothetical protein ACON5H_06935 [Akkermansiaceae bacterium]